MAGSSKSSDKVVPLPTRTDYQLYTQAPGVVDLTERMLMKLWATTATPKRKLELAALIDAYRSGAVAVSWFNGEPQYLRVTKETTGRPVEAEVTG